ncbi:MAG: glycoside hydrolase family 27 protein [Thermoanaerobaculales bacterium]|nr:glycoside hydrolase family 27 protein [Thermoanaerobaculales bacterium]
MRKTAIFFAAVVVTAAANVGAQKFENLALTPPMGWNSWNHFGCDVTEELIRQTADAMVSSGMREAGYLYINIDDCWHGERDGDGFIQPDAERFPSGMRALADYVHSKGLKLGIYSDAGWTTCAGRPGGRGHEYSDALTYARWGIDYLKYDWCATDGLNAEGAYQTMGAALASAGRPMVFSICEWGNNRPWEWGGGIGHMWRTTGDIAACFDCEVDHGDWSSWGVMRILDMQDGLRVHAGPGHWNDPDMMEVGNGMSDSEDRAHFSMWAMLAAPLIAGNDLRTMPEATRRVLTNRRVIEVDQDPLGVQGFKYAERDGLEIWFKPLNGEDWAMCILNREALLRQVRLRWQDELVADEHSGRKTLFKARLYRVRDLWSDADMGTTRQALIAEVPGHDVLMVRLHRLLEAEEQ